MTFGHRTDETLTRHKMKQLAVRDPNTAALALERVLIAGDLSPLDVDERLDYVKKVAKAISDKFIYRAEKAPVRNRVTHEEMEFLKQNNRNVLRFVNKFVGDAFVLKLKSNEIRVVAEHRTNPEAKVLNEVASVLLEYITESLVRSSSGPKDIREEVASDDWLPD